MKSILPVITGISLILHSCGNVETKADPSPISIESATSMADSAGNSESLPSPNDNVKEKMVDKSGQARGVDTNPSLSSNDILAKIDEYLVTIPQYTLQPAGGYTNGVIKVTNNLNDASFQKVILEVTILKADGSLLRTDFYTVINIEAAGGSKVVKIPDNKQGAKLVTHIIKVKSNELTNGESVMTGTHFVAN
jgi:hypothetical protein